MWQIYGACFMVGGWWVYTVTIRVHCKQNSGEEVKTYKQKPTTPIYGDPDWSTTTTTAIQPIKRSNFHWSEIEVLNKTVWNIFDSYKHN